MLGVGLRQHCTRAPQKPTCDPTSAGPAFLGSQTPHLLWAMLCLLLHVSKSHRCLSFQPVLTPPNHPDTVSQCNTGVSKTVSTHFHFKTDGVSCQLHCTKEDSLTFKHEKPSRSPEMATPPGAQEREEVDRDVTACRGMGGEPAFRWEVGVVLLKSHGKY